MSKTVLVIVEQVDKSHSTITDINDEVAIEDLSSQIATNVNERTGEDVEVTVIDIGEADKQVDGD